MTGVKFKRQHGSKSGRKIEQVLFFSPIPYKRRPYELDQNNGRVIRLYALDMGIAMEISVV